MDSPEESGRKSSPFALGNTYKYVELKNIINGNPTKMSLKIVIRI